MFCRTLSAATILVLVFLTGTASSSVSVEKLRCEYRYDPLGIDIVRPRLSWILRSTQSEEKQTAYRVLVASREDFLQEDQGDLWDSGKVTSDSTIHVVYTGQPLKEIEKNVERDKFFDADEAKAFGLVDEVYEKRPETEASSES